MLTNKKNIIVVKFFFKVLRKCCENFTKNLRKFKKILENFEKII